MEHHYASIRRATILDTDNKNAGKGVVHQELSLTAGGKAKMEDILEDSMSVSHKTRHILTT